LVEFLKQKYPQVEFVQKTPKSPWLEFTKSGSILYVNASKVGWYDLDQSIYEKISRTSNSFNAIIFQGTEKVFVLPREKIQEIFTNENKLENQKRPRWMFSIHDNNDNYFLKIRQKNINLNNYLNRWDLIPDFNMTVTEETNKNFFLVQVTEPGSKEILNELAYSHPDWQSNKRDSDHGKVKTGDYLLIYFAGQSIDFERQLKKIYHVDSVSQNNIEFKLSEVNHLNGITLHRIQDALKEKKLSKVFSNIGLQGFNITQIPKEDYKTVLLLDKETDPSNKTISKSPAMIWVVRAGAKGEEENDALANDVVTIHWDELGDISNFYDRDSLKIYYKKMLPHESEGTIAQAVGQVWSFLREIKKNDIVIIPLISKQSKFVAIGIVVGDYEFQEITPDIKQIRKVKWLHKDIPIDEFSDTTKKSLYGSRTVYQIQNQESLKSIKKVMKKYKIFDGFINDIKTDENISKPSQPESVTSIGKLAQSLYLPEHKLKTIQTLLEQKKQIIFYGPPGTSKTFVAKKFAEYFTNGTENVEIIQFHPSYSYEDFMEGIKPKLSAQGEAIGFIKQPGIFKNLVDKCIQNPDKKFVLIIDEINRGNISKIFGELIYLLEYRNDKIHLTYSPDEEFFIPDNLYIIGTMNSADRSIAFVDYALRRRFYFIEFYPDAENEDILKKWFAKNRINELIQNNVLELIKQINIEISNKLGRDYQIGYSYFMTDLNYEKVKRIINYAIIPLVEQYFFGKKDNVDSIKNICDTFLTKIQIKDEKISLS